MTCTKMILPMVATAWLALMTLDTLLKLPAMLVICSRDENCAIWAMLRILGGHDSVKGYGTLLENHLKA